MRNQNIDITNFEEKMNKFKEGFARNYDLASSKFQEAIAGIDKTIKELEKNKGSLTIIGKQFALGKRENRRFNDQEVNAWKSNDEG